jgi:hypothetical protein
MNELDHEKLDVYVAAIDFVVWADEVVERLPRGRISLTSCRDRARARARARNEGILQLAACREISTPGAQHARHRCSPHRIPRIAASLASGWRPASGTAAPMGSR